MENQGDNRGMALLKSQALMEQEALAELQSKERDACHAILEGWRAKLPITSISTEPPPGVFVEDTKPFGYCNSLRPAPNKAPQKRWSEI
jgi:hypothetical protein